MVVDSYFLAHLPNERMNIQLRYSPNTGFDLVQEIGSLLQVSEPVVPAKVFYHVTGTQTLN